MKRRPAMLPVALAAAFTIVAAGCTTSSGAGGSSPGSSGSPSGVSGTLTIAEGSTISTLDPAAQVSLTSYQIVMQMVQSLTQISPSGQVEPLLATSWTMAPDGKSFTFNLRTGVKFSDGETFNASAVKFSIDRLLNPQTYEAEPSTLTVIKDVTVISPYQVRISLSSAYPSLPNLLALPAAGIIAPDSVNKAPNTFAKIQDPVGTGPYIYQGQVPGSSITLTANPHYWGTPKPAFAKQVWEIVPDAASQLALLESNGAQVIEDPPASNLASLQKSSTYKVIDTPAPEVVMIGLETQDTREPLLQKAAVREALNYAIDRPLLINTLLDGAGKPVTGPIDSADSGACTISNPYPYNPAKARQLLAAAGAQNLTIKMVAPDGRYLNDYDLAQAVAGELRSVGVHVTLANPTDFATYLATVYGNEATLPMDAYMMGLGDPSLTASGSLGNFMANEQPPKGYNGTHYDSSQFASLFNQANATLNTAQRDSLYCQAQKVLYDASPALFLYQLEVPVAMDANLTGLIGLPSGVIETSWIRQG